MKIKPLSGWSGLAAICFSAFSLAILPLSAKEEERPAPAIELGAPFGDSAILQQGVEVPVWGWSKSGTEVTVEFAGQKKSAKADKEGKWMVKLDKLKVNAEPAEMTISEKGGKTRVLKDILVGEVWMASGQSNMQWVVNKSAGRYLMEKIKADIETGGKKPLIREFKVSNYFAHLHPIEHAEGAWSEDQGNFSAIAFAFAYKLHQELEVPIGILNCSFSQTKIEAWTPRVGFEDSKSEYNQKIELQLKETDPATEQHKAAWKQFYTDVMDAVEENQKTAKSGGSSFKKLPPNGTPGNMGGNRDATWLYNARLHPVVPYAISGCIWNQGYANSGGGLTYYDNLHAMIRGWRKVWGQPELPVYFHQFYSPGNNVNTGPNHPSLGSTAEMRLGTWLARDIPHTGMASQIDVQGAIHYGNKIVPGQRLALHALKNQYGKEMQTDGPMLRDTKVEGSKLIVSFYHAEGGLVVADTAFNANKRNEGATGFADPKIIEKGDDKVTLFYLAGEDRVWHPAKVKIEGDQAVVTSDAVKKPRGVAYGTGGIGFQPNLYNKALLPTTPFIVYDGKLVTSKDWPDSPIKIAGVEEDPSSVGLIYQYRKMPILSTQFRTNAVLQAGQPITFWGSAVHDWGFDAEGEAEIHFRFGDIEKIIPVKDGMKQWKFTVPAMKATDKPRTLKVKLTIDGELAHERVAENIIIGDVWYIGGPLGKQEIGTKGEIVDSPVRIIQREAKGVKHRNERPYSVATSTTPGAGNRFASFWSEPAGDGLVSKLAEAIHEKTGKPVGIIYMADPKGGLEFKHWMDVPSLAKAPSLKQDYEDIAAVSPGTSFYKKNAENYIEAWKAYWADYIPEMIESKAVPDDAAWGSYPQLAGSVTTDATQTYNCLIASFKRTQLKGILFITEESMMKDNEGKDFGSEISAMANGWKRLFDGEKDPHFIYTIPSKDLSASISKPEDIEGDSTSHEVDEWGQPGDDLLDAVLEAAY